MANTSSIAGETQSKLNRLQAELRALAEDIEDVTLTQDDLEAIAQGRRDHNLNSTRRL